MRLALRRFARSARGAGMVLGAFLLGGCYTYVPVERPAPGVPVRVRVEVSSGIVNPNRAQETTAVEGRIVSAGDTLALEVVSRQEYGAFREVTRQDTVRIARSRVASLEQRTFSKGRSVALGVTLAAGTTVLAMAALGLGGDQQGSDPGDGGGPVGSVIAGAILSGILRLAGR
ncbi:MAG: hypothetical protein ACE5GJ_04605 [Gemmatimonadota bacterium]